MQCEGRIRVENLQPVISIRLQSKGDRDVDADRFNVSFIYPLLAAATGVLPECANERREERKERCGFQMLMKINISCAQPGSGLGVSSDSMMGVRKCRKARVSSELKEIR